MESSSLIGWRRRRIGFVDGIASASSGLHRSMWSLWPEPSLDGVTCNSCWPKMGRLLLRVMIMMRINPRSSCRYIFWEPAWQLWHLWREALPIDRGRFGSWSLRQRVECLDCHCYWYPGPMTSIGCSTWRSAVSGSWHLARPSWWFRRAWHSMIMIPSSRGRKKQQKLNLWTAKLTRHLDQQTAVELTLKARWYLRQLSRLGLVILAKKNYPKRKETSNKPQITINRTKPEGEWLPFSTTYSMPGLWPIFYCTKCKNGLGYRLKLSSESTWDLLSFALEEPFCSGSCCFRYF